MDIIFNCPFCDQELAADPVDSGTEIECPSCSKTIKIPAAGGADVRSAPVATAAPAPEPVAPAGGPSTSPHRPMKEFTVPQRATSESLIQKPNRPLEVAAKDTGRHLRVKTIKHGDCVEVGKDKFDEVTTDFLAKIGDDNFVSITPVSYTHVDVGTQKFIADFAVVIVYKG